MTNFTIDVNSKMVIDEAINKRLIALCDRLIAVELAGIEIANQHMGTMNLFADQRLSGHVL